MFQPNKFYHTHSVKSHKHLSQSMKFICSSFSLITIILLLTYKAHFLAVPVRKISQGLKSTSRIWKSIVIGLRKFRLISADACGGGTCAKSLRESAWEANPLHSDTIRHRASSLSPL